MYTIKEASSRSGVPVASLRAWERRYGVVEPQRTESGYRLYDDQAIAALSTMRRLVDMGWSPSAAAAAISSGEVAADAQPPTYATVSEAGRAAHPEAESLTEELLVAASAVDVVAIESVLDRGFALGTFETVVDTWLMPALHELGEAWASGRVDVAGEHAASYAVMRRLGQSFAAASSLGGGRRVLVGLPSGSHHELGALAFATAARRSGLAVVYVGADLPVESWRRAVQSFPTRVAVLAVPTEGDRPMAVRTVRALLDSQRDIVVAAGGRYADDLDPAVVRLPGSMAEAARVREGLRP
ncbi:MAG TPA: MerR family transcriptional regulator [Ornithinibacter sp.]|nr:MerR family transcriptional regulator [Ornithinibacter sp.]